MKIYRTPLKNPMASSLSFLLGFTVIALIMLFLRVVEQTRLSRIQETKTVLETAPTDTLIPVVKEQPVISNSAEKDSDTPPNVEQKTVPQPTSDVPKIASPSTVKPVPATIPSPKKSDRTTRTS